MLVMGFAVSGVIVNGQTNCKDASPDPKPSLCEDSSYCGASKCSSTYDAKQQIASTSCEEAQESCKLICQCETFCDSAQTILKNGLKTAVSAATAVFQNMLNSGTFGDAQCNEMSSCVTGSPSLNDAPKITECQASLSSAAREEVIKKYIGKEAQIVTEELDIIKFAPELNKHPEFQIPNNVAGQLKFANGLSSESFTNEFYQAQSSALRASEAARQAVAFANQYGLRYLAEKSFIDYLTGFFGLKDFSPEEIAKSLAKQGLSSVASKLAGIIFGGGGGDAAQASHQNGVQNAARYALDTVLGNPITNNLGVAVCPNKPEYGGSIGQPDCIWNPKDGFQCFKCIPNYASIFTGSIHVIDNKLNNMFTMTGKENEGIVYQKDGFVNIDKGGTTKLSVAGEGAFITDASNNQLYVGAGTTTYLGIGNEDKDTYLTNSVIYDFKSKVGVDNVNEIEQKRLQKSPTGSQKQAFELAVTFNKHDLKPYKNSIDIGKLQEHYQILTRGFSNIILLENSKVFPIATRNYAKGDSLIVKYKNVRISNDYLVNDESYEYAIKSIDDSTKVIAKNGKVIQDSGPFSYKLSKRQSLLVYNI